MPRWRDSGVRREETGEECCAISGGAAGGCGGASDSVADDGWPMLCDVSGCGDVVGWGNGWIVHKMSCAVVGACGGLYSKCRGCWTHGERPRGGTRRPATAGKACEAEREGMQGQR